MEGSHKTTALKKAYAEMILNTAKESAARVMLSDRKSARFHHDLSETKGEALRLLVRLKRMIDAKTIEAEVISSSRQRQIDVLEAQLHEAEDIITDLRSEVRWVRDRLEKAKAFESQQLSLVNMEQEEEEETVSLHEVDPEVVVESESLVPDQEDCSSLHDVESDKQFEGLSVNTLQAFESQERNLVNMEQEEEEEEEEEETVSLHKVVVESVNPSSLCDVECENDEKQFDGLSVVDTLMAYESQERNIVCEEEDEETVSVHKAVLESLVPAQEDPNSLYDVECENEEKQFDGLSVVDTLKAYESQEGNLMCEEEEEETVSVHEVDPKVVLESLKPIQEDRSSLVDVECENFEKAKASESQEMNLVNIEEEMVSDQKVVLESLKPDEEVADTCFSHEKHFDGSSVVDTSMGCESELDGDIRIKKLELSRNGCTQRVHALERIVLERQSSSSADVQGTAEKDSEENLSSGNLENTRGLVLALRASSAEVVTLPSLGIKKTCRKLRGRRKWRFGKPKAKSVRTQSQLIKPCQSQSTNVTSSKTSTSDAEDSHLSLESMDVDDFKTTCKELKEHLQLKRTLESGGDISIARKGEKSKHMHVTDHFVEVCQESNLVSINVEDADIPENETKTKPLPCLTLSKEDGLVDVLISCEGEEDSVIPSTKTASSLVNLDSDSRVSAVVSDQISESPPRENVNRLLKYTFQRKRKRGSANINEGSNNLPRENEAQDQIETTFE